MPSIGGGLRAQQPRGHALLEQMIAEGALCNLNKASCVVVVAASRVSGEGEQGMPAEEMRQLVRKQKRRSVRGPEGCKKGARVEKTT